MSEVQILFTLLGGLYAWECACWLRRGGVAFTTWTGQHWKPQHPAVMLGNQNGGFIWVAPLPPLGQIFCLHQIPFSLGLEGVLFFVSANVNPGWRPSQSGRFLNWEQVRAISLGGKKILLNGTLVFSAPTPTLAQLLHKILTHIANQPAAQRASAIKQVLASSLDVKLLENRVNEFRHQMRPVRLLINALFILIFILAPLLIWQIGLTIIWPGLLIGILALTITTATFFYRIHRAFYPVASDDRFTQTLIIALAPASTMRTQDVVSRPLLENFHPVAGAKSFLAPDAFRRFARRFLLDLRHPALPTCPNPEPQAIATEHFFRCTFSEIIEVWLKEQQISPEDLCRPPSPTDESCRGYCPRCEAQFTTPTGHCADCGGLQLVAFAKAS